MTFTQLITNAAQTLNRAISNKSSLSACLDLFSMGVSSSDKHSLIKAAGLERPTLIFWRVDVKLNQQPVTFDDNGTILINGYSPAIMKTILSLDMDELANITPMNLFLRAVNVDKYSFVDTIFKDRI